MPEKTKSEEKDNRKKEKTGKFLRETDKDDWENDQREKSYYYDDAHGYEIYKPDEEDDEDDDKED